MFFSQATAEEEENYFVVTAYYSPLPDQEYYFTGNYESEIRLQWRGTNGASGKPVFSGMLAAPKTYEFGTKIYLEWLWVGEVSDRWWAIVSAGNRGYKYDRIDVWMGYGDEGLKRALAWGKRTVKWYVIDPRNETDIDINKHQAPNWALNNATKAEIENYKADRVEEVEVVKEIEIKEVPSVQVTPPKEEQKEDILEIFNKALSGQENVEKLQIIMTELWLYSWEINWKHEDLVWPIYDYQIDKKIVKAETDSGAWVFGPKTRTAMKNEYKEFLAIKAKEEARKEEIKEKYMQIESVVIPKARREVEYLEWIAFSETSTRVRDFQLLLKKLGYFNEKDTAIFGEKTKEALLNFQADYKIIERKDDEKAGIVEKETIEMLIEVLAKYYMKEELDKMPELEEMLALN